VNSFGLDICDVCGTQSADHAGWFAIAGNGASMEVLPWSDDVRHRSDCRHACCGEHAETLVLSTAATDLAGSTFLSSPKRGGWSPEALLPPVSDTLAAIDGDDSLLSLLSAVESILQSDDDEPTARFDA
jgi:hypothetical protein